MSNQELTHAEPVNEQEIFAMARPDKNLLPLYIIYALMTTIAFPFTMLPLYFKFKTMKYRFDAEGVSVSYGILWRRESYTTYSRIQDIHVSRNIAERWLGIGTVDIQTASGSSTSEVSIVGVRQYEQIRDFLYARMRGVKLGVNDGSVSKHEGENTTVELLKSIRNDLQAVRLSLEEKKHG